jgi:hypothetical protein
MAGGHAGPTVVLAGGPPDGVLDQQDGAAADRSATGVRAEVHGDDDANDLG